jgi:hypothetical protein
MESSNRDRDRDGESPESCFLFFCEIGEVST